MQNAPLQSDALFPDTVLGKVEAELDTNLKTIPLTSLFPGELIASSHIKQILNPFVQLGKPQSSEDKPQYNDNHSAHPVYHRNCDLKDQNVKLVPLYYKQVCSSKTLSFFVKPQKKGVKPSLCETNPVVPKN